MNLLNKTSSSACFKRGFKSKSVPNILANCLLASTISSFDKSVDERISNLGFSISALKKIFT